MTVDPVDRPLPQPTELTLPFWEACRRRALVAPRCGECGRWFFTPELACPYCLSRDWSWAESAGRGTVYSYTTVHRAPHPAFDAPYVLAIVELEEGYHMLTNIVRCAPEHVVIGMRVDATFHDVGQITLPMFAPHGPRLART